jgi:glycosyltransferase involved in cell wall biosynthesis
LRNPNHHPTIVACIPAFNEERHLAAVIRGARPYVDLVIVCDDGSRDKTSEVARALGAKVVRHERNLGYGSALSTLFDSAREENAEIVVTIDADGQHNPRDIPRLASPIMEGGADIVIGSRFLESSRAIPGYRKLGIRVITGATNLLSNQEITDGQSGFRCYNAHALNLISSAEMGMGASIEILMSAREKGLSIAEVPVKILYEEKAARNPVYHGIDVTLSLVKHLSIRHPLLFYGAPGFLLFLIGMGFGLWALDIFSLKSILPTGPALAAVASVTVGLVLMTTGMILWIMVTLVKSRAQN